MTAFGNRILEAMPAADLAALEPHLRLEALSSGTILIRQGTPVDRVHFPTSAVLGNALGLEDGSAVETSAVGPDGVSGLAAFLAEAPLAWELSVQTAGEAWSVSAELFRQRVVNSPPLLNLLLRVTYDAQCQGALTAACNAEHDARQRLAKWLLLLSDRAQSAVLSLTQQEIAVLLGTERTTINAAVQSLRERGAILISRGKLEIYDRRVLEQDACGCYRAQRRWTDGLGLPVETVQD